MNISCLPLLSINVQKATSTVDFEISNPKDKDRNESYVFSLSGPLGRGFSLSLGAEKKPRVRVQEEYEGGAGLGAPILE